MDDMFVMVLQRKKQQKVVDRGSAKYNLICNITYPMKMWSDDARTLRADMELRDSV